MISVDEAKNCIRDLVPEMKPKTVALMDSVGCVLAGDVTSAVNIPAFDQSSMDGFAVRFADGNTQRFSVQGEIPAGSSRKIQIRQGEAYRIFTGAPVPDETDAIVIQEAAEVCEETMSSTDAIKPGAFIRRAGTQTKQGDIVLRAGTILTPAAIGYLASCGVAQVPVIGKPKVAMVITGNELAVPGQPLLPGQVYDSNSFALQAALRQFGIPVYSLQFVRDDKEELSRIVATAIADADVVLISGGISVGKYDFAGQVLEQCGVETFFYKVAQKPGKPLFAGKTNGKTIFALPGNPASVLVCFYEYVVPAIRVMMGYPWQVRKPERRKLTMQLENKDDRTSFVRARQDGINVTPMEGQDSYMMRSFAAADCFIKVPRLSSFRKGESVEVSLIPVHL